MKEIKLNKREAQDALDKFLSFPKYDQSVNAGRLEKVVGLLDENGEANLQKYIDIAFNNTSDPLNAISQTSKDIQRKAQAQGFNLKLVKDNFKSNPLQDRKIWLEGDDSKIDLMLEKQEQQLRQPDSDIDNSARPSKDNIFICICFAKKDATSAEQLKEALKDVLNLSQNYNFIIKKFDEVLAGENKKRGIEKNINAAQLIIILESAAFYCDEEITKYINPYNENQIKSRIHKIFPISISQLTDDPDIGELQGLKTFSLDGRGFNEIVDNNRTKFVRLLQKQIHQKLENFKKRQLQDHKRKIDQLEKSIYLENENYVEGDATKQKIAGLYETGYQKREKAIDLINKWLSESKAPLFALLGQYGMGKTFTSKVFAKRQIQKYKQQESHYIPIYFDLRDFEYQILNTPGFDIWDVIESILNRRKLADEKHPLKSKDIRDIWEQNPTVIIFDGLDEVITHIGNTKIETTFLNEIFKLIPNFHSKIEKENQQLIDRKMLLTCRTDYFKTLAAQNSFFKAQSREHIDPNKDYESCILLPFNTNQVRIYLEQVLPDKDSGKIMEMFKDIHNLDELSKRPVLLDFLTEIIDGIESLVSTGREIKTVTIYERMVNMSFERDKDKHEIPTEIKVTVLEDIAAFLWKKASRRIAFSKLAEFLSEYLSAGSAAMKKLYYQKDEEALYKDLRNATLLVRSNEKDFGFSHTSIQEYFLARYILKNIEKADFEALEIKNVSRETIDFLLELLSEKDAEDRDLIVDNFKISFKDTSKVCRELMFKIFQKDFVGSRILEKPDPLNLQDLELNEFCIRGNPFNYVDLSHANMKNTKWINCEWMYVNFDHADFSNSTIRNLLNIQNVSLNNAIFTNASVNASWRNVNANNINVENADFQHSKVIKSDWQPTGQATEVPEIIKPVKKISTKKCRLIKGHVGNLKHFDVVREDKIMTCSYDGKLILWDLNTERVIREFDEHLNQINHFVIIGDDKMLSCSNHLIILWDINSGKSIKHLPVDTEHIIDRLQLIDNNTFFAYTRRGGVVLWKLEEGTDDWTNPFYGKSWQLGYAAIKDNLILGGTDGGRIILWDMNQKKIIKKLKGYKNDATQFAFLSDGKILSASSSNYLTLWNLDTEEVIREFRGHFGSCRFTLVGNDRFISYSNNPSTPNLILWDINERCPIHQLEEHQGRVNDCIYLGDNRALSTSDDRTLILWDLESGKLIDKFETSYFPISHLKLMKDNKVLSQSVDGTIRLWDVKEGKVEKTLKRHSRAVQDCIMIGEDKFLSYDYNKTLILWDLNRKKIIHQFLGHPQIEEIKCVPINSNKALSYSLNSLILWDLQNGGMIHNLVGHSDKITNCVSIGTNKALSCGYDGVLILWDLEDGNIIHRLEGHNEKENITCSFANEKRAISRSNKVIISWNLEKGTEISRMRTDVLSYCIPIRTDKILSYDGMTGMNLRNTDTLKSICQFEDSIFMNHFLSIDINRVVSWSSRDIALWDLDKREKIRQLKITLIRGCKPIENNKLVIWTGKERERVLIKLDIEIEKLLDKTDELESSLVVWDLESGKVDKINDVDIDHCLPLGNNKVLTWTQDNYILTIWDLKKRKVVNQLIGHTSKIIHCYQIDKEKVLSYSLDGSIRLWNINKGELVTFQHLNDDGYAVLEDGQLLDYSDNAWEHLEWITSDNEEKTYYHFDEVIFSKSD